MRSVCEKRNAALQGTEKSVSGTYHIGDTYFERDVRYDISQFMRFINRKLNGQLSPDYAAYELYCHQQKTYFKKLKKVKKKRKFEECLSPGKTSFKDAGIYNGLP